MENRSRKSENFRRFEGRNKNKSIYDDNGRRNEEFRKYHLVNGDLKTWKREKKYCKQSFISRSRYDDNSLDYDNIIDLIPSIVTLFTFEATDEEGNSVVKLDQRFISVSEHACNDKRLNIFSTNMNLYICGRISKYIRTVKFENSEALDEWLSDHITYHAFCYLIVKSFIELVFAVDGSLIDLCKMLISTDLREVVNAGFDLVRHFRDNRNRSFSGDITLFSLELVIILKRGIRDVSLIVEDKIKIEDELSSFYYPIISDTNDDYGK